MGWRPVLCAPASLGAETVINYCTDKTGADNTAARIHELGVKALAIQGDVAKVDDVRHLFETAQSTFGKIDIAMVAVELRTAEPIVALRLLGNRLFRSCTGVMIGAQLASRVLYARVAPPAHNARADRHCRLQPGSGVRHHLPGGDR